MVLTAAAAVLAMIPLTRSVFWGPMAISIMGGLVVATALTLVFVPALYATWFRIRRDSPAQAPAAAPLTVTAGDVAAGQLPERLRSRPSLHMMVIIFLGAT